MVWAPALALQSSDAIGLVPAPPLPQRRPRNATTAANHAGVANLLVKLDPAETSSWRSQRTDLEEFWPTVDPRSPDVGERLAEWQHLWNLERPHSALGGKTPIDRICELLAKIPSAEAVEAAYDPAKERIRVADYTIDSTLARVK